jgi:hypothetical protein
MSVPGKQDSCHYRSLPSSTGVVPLAAPGMPAPLPAGVPNPASIAELAVQLWIGAGALLHAPMAVAVFVLLAPDQRISLRVKPTMCSARHASKSPCTVTREQADSLSSVRRRRNVRGGKHTPHAKSRTSISSDPVNHVEQQRPLGRPGVWAGTAEPDHSIHGNVPCCPAEGRKPSRKDTILMPSVARRLRRVAVAAG